MIRMLRLPAVLCLGLLCAVSCRRPAPPPPPATVPGPRLGFHFRPGEKIKMVMKGDFDFKDRAIGLDRDGLYMSGTLSCYVEIEILKEGKSGFSARLTPRSFDYKSGEDELAFKEGKLTRSPSAERDGLELPVKPYDLRVMDDGFIADVRPDQGPPGFMFAGPVLTQPPTLLGFLGVLGDVEIRETARWSASVGVALSPKDAIPLNVAAESVRKTESGWTVLLSIRIDGRSDRYGWFKTCVEDGECGLDLDEQGRPVRALIRWVAKTADEKPIARYQGSCEFSR
jgi:hypothetical protein